ncbi:MAG: Na+/H+ antiporter subunit E [Mycobacteriaceae bacterium]
MIPQNPRTLALRIWVLGWLTFVWVFLWGTVTTANIVTGMTVGLVIMIFLPLPRVPVEGRVHLFSLALLIVRVNYYLILSSAQVAWIALRPGPAPLSAVLRASLAIKSDLVLSLAVEALNLIPGGVVLEIDQARRLIYVHVLDVGSARSVQRFYSQVSEIERLFIASFERDTEWRPHPKHKIHQETQLGREQS